MADQILCDLLTQRKNYLMNRTPPVRNTPINPYSQNYTSTDLNMRRKVEILKYNKNSTQGSKPTRTEQFASLARGNYRQSRINCPNNKYIPTLSNKAGVPGPPIILQEKPEIPLYNYNSDTYNYAVALHNTSNNPEWQYYIEPNKLCLPNVNTLFSTVSIQETITGPYRSFTIITPVVFKLTGNDIDKIYKDIPITANIYDIEFQPYYNNQPVYNNVLLTTSFIDTAVPTIDTVLDYQGNDETFQFSCEKYVGLLKIENIIVQTEPSFIYEFNINYKTEINDNNSNMKFNMTFGIYLNINDSYIIPNTVNCSTPLNPGTSAKTISFEGVPI